ncbi:MAG: hypothetical protein AB7V22_02240 [Kiritimatiellia bacterium]
MCPDRPRPPKTSGRAGVAAFLRRAAPAAGVGLILAAVLAGNEHVRVGAPWLPHQLRFWGKLALLLGAAFLGASGWAAWRQRLSRRGRLAAELVPALLLAGGLGLLFTGAMHHPWTYFLNWIPEAGSVGSALRSGLPQFVLLTGALTPWAFRRRRWGWALTALLIAAQLACFAALLRTTGGAALYKDDHPSFLFRLWEFAQTFPRFINYNPWWNGGQVNAYCTTSGTGALGVPLLPLWRFLPVHAVYTFGLGLAYIVGLPLLAAVSLRIMGASRTAAACAGLLALGVSRHFFLWLLHYGTVCAPLVAAFMLPTAACLYRVFWLDRREIWLGAALVVCVLMLLQWPPGGLMALPLALGALAAWRQWTWKKIRFLLVCAGLVLAVAVRRLLVILLKGGAVVAHVTESGGDATSIAWGPALTDGFHFLVAHLQEVHPVLLILGFAGLCVPGSRAVRRWFGVPVLAFALLVGWGPQFLPNLELGRMAIPMTFLAVAPAAVWAARLLRGGDGRLAPVRAALVVLLGLGAGNVAKLYGNQGWASYRVLPPEIHEFAARLRAEVPEDGRVLFAGAMVHYFGHGHVAYLPVLAEREMMAVDYYHFPMTYVEYEYPPHPFYTSPQAVLDFIRLYNVTHVVTYHERWKKVFRDLAPECEELAGFESIRASVFRMNRRSSPFVQGAGRVRAAFNVLDVQVERPDQDAILCYNWAAGLSAPAPVELFRHDAGRGVELIGVRPNGCREFRIRHRSWL